MATPKKTPKLDHTFSGVCRSIQCYNNQGFSNFRIVKLTLEQGQVVQTEYSDPYASFEALIKIELYTRDALINLMSNWMDGRTLSK